LHSVDPGVGSVAQDAQGLQRAANVLVDPGTVTGEGEELPNRRLGGRALGCSRGKGRKLQGVQAVLAPHRGDQLPHLAALVGVTRAPVGGDGGVQGRELLAVLAGEQGERAAAQAVAGAVAAERALPASVAGPCERAPLARAAACWACVRVAAGMAVSAGGEIPPAYRSRMEQDQGSRS
jgi:hypothetical protein